MTKAKKYQMETRTIAGQEVEVKVYPEKNKRPKGEYMKTTKVGGSIRNWQEQAIQKGEWLEE